MASPVIKALAPATIHKIAAGEVIERPANAVKELVENALDARAGKITVAIEEGGMELIKVSDNGVGMTREDAAMAWLPHTTSKIREADDLMRVATYGFRGEALCSIAAVAELTLETRHASEETGIAITVSGSREVETREISRNPGTTVTVRNLFLHSPVRRKFMGTGRTEASRILGMLSRVALAHPGTAFKVTDKGREVLSLAEGGLKHRVGEILGFNITNDLVPVEWSDGAIHVEGYVSTAQQARQRASHQYFFINRRAIQSGVIARALSQSYDVLPPGRFPMAALFITMPTEEVDVNVHPTKKEVRFLNDSRVFWSVSKAVKTALLKDSGAPALDLDFPSPPDAASVPPPTGAPERPAQAGPDAFHQSPPFGAAHAFPAVPASGASPSPHSAPVSAAQGAAPGAAPAFRYAAAVPAGPAIREAARDRAGSPEEGEDAGGSLRLSRVAEPADPLVTGKLPPHGAGPGNQLRLFPGEGRIPGPAASDAPAGPASATPFGSQWGSARDGGKSASPFAGVPFLQIHSGFILFGVQSGLMMVNQQAAHERILYEKAMDDLRQPGRFSSQQLLFPEVVEFPPGDSHFLEEHLDKLQSLGFDLEAFGGNAFQLRGLPVDVRPDQARRVMFDLVEGLLRPERGASGPKGEEFIQRLARVYARVTSVKLGDPLDYPQVASLIDGLFATQNPYVSPSGAPIVVRLSLEEIHRKFGLKP
jgi:DNA mismatch repair protein MutL